MSFNVAVLYDIENLIGGYGKDDLLFQLSLKKIFKQIKEKISGQIAIQRAYANWSNPKLGFLRGDIVELGIDPIQVFGFGKGSQKNASDIQLAIDAMEIAFTKNAIEVFVIVSGDGGFSSLAKKLHEYGKKVIGCGYPKNTNKVFQAVSDDFIWIDKPQEEESITHANTKNQITNPIVKEFALFHKNINNADHKTIIQEAKNILHFLVKNTNSLYLLSNSGLNISVLSQLLNYRFSNFNYSRLGFVKLIDFLRYLTHDSPCKLVFKAPSDYRIILKNKNLANYETVEPITEEYIHSKENYIKLLGKGSTPNFRQFNKALISSIAEYMVNNKEEFEQLHLGDILDKLSAEFDLEQSELKNTVITLLSGKCFSRKPEEAKLSEQILSFLPEKVDEVLPKIEKEMKEKLKHTLGEYKEEVFKEILA